MDNNFGNFSVDTATVEVPRTGGGLEQVLDALIKTVEGAYSTLGRVKVYGTGAEPLSELVTAFKAESDKNEFLVAWTVHGALVTLEETEADIQAWIESDRYNLGERTGLFNRLAELELIRSQLPFDLKQATAIICKRAGVRNAVFNASSSPNFGPIQNSTLRPRKPKL